jgi:hypothetical protein
MHEIIDKKFYLGLKFGTLSNRKWITISELLHVGGDAVKVFDWPQINAGDRRSWQFEGFQEDLLTPFERGHDEELSCGSAASKWLPKHHRRRPTVMAHPGI